MKKTLSLIPLLALALLTVVGCVPMNDPYYSNGYDNRDRYDYDNDRYDDYRRDRERDRAWEERRRLERERDRLEEERRRLEEERRRDRDNHSHMRPPPPVQERCPSGFHPSEQKCSREERRRGCQDMRLPGGLGCVKR